LDRKKNPSITDFEIKNPKTGILKYEEKVSKNMKHKKALLEFYSNECLSLYTSQPLQRRSFGEAHFNKDQ